MKYESKDFIDFLTDLDNRINAGTSTDDIKTLIGQKINKISGSNEAKAVRQNEQTQEEFICVSKYEGVTHCLDQCELCKEMYPS